MSASYRLIQWNPHKRVYDIVVTLAILIIFAGFVFISKLTAPDGEAISDEVLLIRASAVCGFTLLHITLAIGPLARLWPAAAALLYNRRHLGVATFLICLFHATLATLYYGAFGGVNPLRAILGSGDLRSISGFPFEWLGFAALLILALLAATSHDFWLKVLSPRLWKWLHMLVYVAYALLVAHVLLGALQSERHWIHAAALTVGAATLATLHTLAAISQHRADHRASREAATWLTVAEVTDFTEGRARTVCPQGRESIAVFLHQGEFHAVANTCVHQGGPLGEGAIIDGCITCPWHGYQYLPQTGASPPPFTEKLATYEVRVEGRTVQVRSHPKDQTT
jgi:nitrite reductase/ring-hydroxylating ferredoxin subunit/DMSO/TMAO reductase YedYZ heme-binding membrane subunit